MRRNFVFVLTFVLMLGLVTAAGYNLVVPASVVDSSSGSGGGSSGSSFTSGLTYVLTDEQFLTGFSGELGVNDRFKVEVGAETHYVKVTELTATTVSINVSSVTQQAILAVGDTKKFNVNADDYYDLAVTLVSINSTSSKANIFIKSVHELVSVGTDSGQEGKGVVATTSGDGEVVEGGSLWWLWVIILIIVVVSVIIFLKKRREW